MINSNRVAELLTHILYELRTLRKELTAKPAPRVFVPEDVRRALGADKVMIGFEGGFWRVYVSFDAIPSTASVTGSSVTYSALSSEGFTTAEAIDAIQRQRPTVQA